MPVAAQYPKLEDVTWVGFCAIKMSPDGRDTHNWIFFFFNWLKNEKKIRCTLCLFTDSKLLAKPDRVDFTFSDTKIKLIYSKVSFLPPILPTNQHHCDLWFFGLNVCILVSKVNKSFYACQSLVCQQSNLTYFYCFTMQIIQ